MKDGISETSVVKSKHVINRKLIEFSNRPTYIHIYIIAKRLSNIDFVVRIN